MFGQVIKDKTLTVIGWDFGLELNLIMAKPIQSDTMGI